MRMMQRVFAFLFILAEIDFSNMRLERGKMNTNDYCFGALIQMNGSKYRVLNVTPQRVTVCKVEVNYLEIQLFSHRQMLNAKLNNQFEVIPEKEYMVYESLLSQRALEKFRKQKNAINRIVSVYAPDFIDLTTKVPKPVIDEIVREGDFSRKTILRMITRYLQSGMKDYSLVNKNYYLDNSNKDKLFSKRTGRAASKEDSFIKTAETIKQFEECEEIYRKSEGKLSISQAYTEYLLQKYYTVTVYEDDGNGGIKAVTRLREEGEYPSIHQFRWHMAKHLSSQEKQEIKYGRRKYQNDRRALSGSSETGVEMPYGMVEMDAVEFDVSLVDEFNRTVGRPIIYMMKDVLTRMIIAVSVSFDNNSITGYMNCFANLNEDKKKLCRKYGINDVTDEMWPTGFKPRMMRYDNGSDFVSKRVALLLKDLNIERSTVPPAMGSYKAVIERSFHDAHQQLNHFFAGYGHIKKDAYNANHHKEATLTIDEFAAMFYRYVIQYNTSRNSGIPMTKEMISAGVMSIPSEVMKYYLNYMTPQRLPAGDEFLKLLLDSDTAAVCRQGILYKNLFYKNEEDENLNELINSCIRCRKPLPILYDSRSVDRIYYMSDGILRRAFLNEDIKFQRTYKGLSFPAYLELMKTARKTDKTAKRQTLEKAVEVSLQNKEIVNNAKSNLTPSTKNMRKSREEAKQKRSNALALDDRVGSYVNESNDNHDSDNQEEQRPSIDYSVIFNDDSLSIQEKLEKLSSYNNRMDY